MEKDLISNIESSTRIVLLTFETYSTLESGKLAGKEFRHHAGNEFYCQLHDLGPYDDCRTVPHVLIYTSN